MREEELTYFQALKKAVAAAFRTEHPSIQQPIENWRGQQIADFQESLQLKVRGRISEKWFYTHIKNTQNERLPRIDMLNLLSEYAGYRNWQEFVFKQANKEEPDITEEKTTPVAVELPSKTSGSKVKPLVMAAMVIGLFSMAFLLFSQLSKTATYEICFVDADSGGKVRQAEKIELIWLKENESPITMACDEQGCVQLQEVSGEVTLVVKAPYYRKDTLTRILPNGMEGEEIALKTDDYALMIHLFSTANIKDWKKRRKQLEEMFSDESKIFQVYQGMGVEMLNKTEFIDKLTFPLESLQQIEVLETVYDRKNKIIALRFTQE